MSDSTSPAVTNNQGISASSNNYDNLQVAVHRDPGHTYGNIRQCEFQTWFRPPVSGVSDTAPQIAHVSCPSCDKEGRNSLQAVKVTPYTEESLRLWKATLGVVIDCRECPANLMVLNNPPSKLPPRIATETPSSPSIVNSIAQQLHAAHNGSWRLRTGQTYVGVIDPTLEEEEAFNINAELTISTNCAFQLSEWTFDDDSDDEEDRYLRVYPATIDTSASDTDGATVLRGMSDLSLCVTNGDSQSTNGARQPSWSG
nr:uncharacterized protein CI109_005753 [Kwoniella shandongensis]KAA5525872.1 hypothetical protein CI109_005753 [Kwoniella shandongensis]